MGKKMKAARKIIKAGAFVLPSPRDVEAAKSPRGAWTAATLARWGVRWPPKEGWRAELRRRWEARNPEAAAELRAIEASRSGQDDLSSEYAAIMGDARMSTIIPAVWGSRVAGYDGRGRSVDSSHRAMVITDGMKSDGTLRVLTGDAARRVWLEPIREA